MSDGGTDGDCSPRLSRAASSELLCSQVPLGEGWVGSGFVDPPWVDKSTLTFPEESISIAVCDTADSLLPVRRIQYKVIFYPLQKGVFFNFYVQERSD